MRTTLFILTLSVLGLAGCTEDPQMTNVVPERPCSIDTVLLATNTSDWIPYQLTDTMLRFENDSGEVKVFRQRFYGENTRSGSLDGIFCQGEEHAKRYSNSRSFAYESEDSILIFGNHYIQYLLPPGDLWSYERFVEAPPYETFLLSIQPNPPDNSDTYEINSCVMRLVVNDFDNVVVRDSKRSLEDALFNQSRAIGTRSFEDVYEPTDCQGTSPTFIYRADRGMVAFVDTAGVAWYQVDG